MTENECMIPFHRSKKVAVSMMEGIPCDTDLIEVDVDQAIDDCLDMIRDQIEQYAKSNNLVKSHMSPCQVLVNPNSHKGTTSFNLVTVVQNVTFIKK